MNPDVITAACSMLCLAGMAGYVGFVIGRAMRPSARLQIRHSGAGRGLGHWIATLVYRTAAGELDVVHDIGEIHELHELVERGPHWGTIARIVIFPSQASALTIEEAAAQ